MADITRETSRIDGRLASVRARPNSREMVSGQPIRPMAPNKIEAAAMADPDARPVTLEQEARARPTPRAKTIRRASALTQEEFSARYHIPLGTLVMGTRTRATQSAQPRLSQSHRKNQGRRPRACA